jgi:hypothetical protein
MTKSVKTAGERKYPRAQYQVRFWSTNERHRLLKERCDRCDLKIKDVLNDLIDVWLKTPEPDKKQTSIYDVEGV